VQDTIENSSNLEQLVCHKAKLALLVDSLIKSKTALIVDDSLLKTQREVELNNLRAQMQQLDDNCSALEKQLQILCSSRIEEYTVLKATTSRSCKFIISMYIGCCFCAYSTQFNLNTFY
jgi:hypothetical protein